MLLFHYFLGLPCSRSIGNLKIFRHSFGTRYVDIVDICLTIIIDVMWPLSLVASRDDFRWTYLWMFWKMIVLVEWGTNKHVIGGPTLYMEVSWNRDTPKSSILMVCSIITYRFWVPPFVETSIKKYMCLWMQSWPYVNRNCLTFLPEIQIQTPNGDDSNPNDLMGRSSKSPSSIPKLEKNIKFLKFGTVH